MSTTASAMVVIGVVGGGYAVAIILWSVGYALRQLGPGRKDGRQ